MANKEFLENYPLYKKYKTDKSWHRSHRAGLEAGTLPKPAIKMFCAVCGSDQTFNMVNDYHEQYSNEIVDGRVRDLRYKCASCNKGLRVFLIHFQKEKIDKDRDVLVLEKVGQIPGWSIDIDKELEQTLGDRSEYYKRGLICESQGYGIGAFSYFRRIVEEIIDELLVSVGELIPEDKKGEYQKALEEVQKTTITQEKIDIVKGLLPESLRPGGVNPLAALHSALSEGLHAESDEECLEYADAVKGVLIFLVNRLVKTKEENKSFTESMSKILEKKTKKGVEKKDKEE